MKCAGGRHPSDGRRATSMSSSDRSERTRPSIRRTPYAVDAIRGWRYTQSTLYMVDAIHRHVHIHIIIYTSEGSSVLTRARPRGRRAACRGSSPETRRPSTSPPPRSGAPAHPVGQTVSQTVGQTVRNPSPEYVTSPA
eukprot:7177736-Pyramimonas_sp.AAC.1